MRSLVAVAFLARIALGFPFSGAQAAGGSSQPATPAERPKTPAEQAIDHYNAGIAMRDQAWKLERRAENAEDADRRAKLEAKALKLFRKAVDEFGMATEKKPDFYQAFSSLGYALRRTGEFDEAIGAYDRALAIRPDYAEAIEYRAEAYLGLDRLEDAKAGYSELFELDRPKADELLGAMKRWIDDRRSNPGRVDGATVSDFADWVAKREEEAGRSASLATEERPGW